MILERKHLGCLDFKERSIHWITRSAKAITHMLAHNPESIRQGDFYTLLLRPDTYAPEVGDNEMLTLGAMIVAAGWPAVTLKRTQTDDGEMDLVFVMLYYHLPAWVPDEYTITPHVIGAPPENLKHDTRDWTVFLGTTLHTLRNPYYLGL